jgi:proteasome lid subunit RPN8/RPN11
MPDLSIPQHILDQIVTHARELAPFECCGLLAGTNKTVTHLYRITNIVAVEGAEKLSTFDDDKVAHLERLSPEERAEIAFVMDMGDFSAAKKDIRKNGLDLQVVYHSHPKDPARPSHTDIKIATDYEEIWERINLPVPPIFSCHSCTPPQRTSAPTGSPAAKFARPTCILSSHLPLQ